MKRNSHDAATGVIEISSTRMHAIGRLAAHYTALQGDIGDGPAYAAMREQISLPDAPLGIAPKAIAYFHKKFCCLRRPSTPPNKHR